MIEPDSFYDMIVSPCVSTCFLRWSARIGRHDRSELVPRDNRWFMNVQRASTWESGSWFPRRATCESL